MSIDKDDPKLTAYALGELEGDEQAAVAAAVEADPQLQAAVDEVRQLVGVVSEALAAEPCPQLSARQQADPSGRRRHALTWMLNSCRLWQGVAAAAIVAAVGLGILASMRRYSPAFLAGRDAEEKAQEPPAPPRTVVHSPRRKPGYVDESAKVTLYSGPNATAVSPHDTKDSMLGLREPGVVLNTGGRVLAGDITEASVNGITFSLDADQVMMEKTYDDASTRGRYGPSLEDYAALTDNPFRWVDDHPLSTFSIDVDTASYANVRRFLRGGDLPPKDAVRIEEMVNYFSYGYAPPAGDAPFAAHLAVAACPWAPTHRLVRVAIKGKEVAAEDRPPSNLVFLIDVSGSMQDANKLPLVKAGLKMLAETLRSRDTVAMVVYAGASGLVLPGTQGTDKNAIIAALDKLQAGGSTNGGAGIELAYKIAAENFIPKGNNRVILCTDGDFNVGTTIRGDLTRLIEAKAKTGVFLSVLGFGTGNTKDSTMESLADKGNGNYAYIDTLNEARKVLVDQGGGTLLTIAKDVKVQVEFNPLEVAGYRLIGYANRLLAAEDFNDDAKDAGEIGAGHTITAFYEVVPASAAGKDGVTIAPAVDPLRYQTPATPSEAARTGELLTLRIRYKAPDGDASKKLEFHLADAGESFAATDRDFQFASAVAAFGMILRDSQYKGAAGLPWVAETASAAVGDDPFGYRAEFLELVRKAATLKKGQ